MNARRIVLEVPAPADYQAAGIFGPHRYALIEASTKTGKTVYCFWWLYDLMASGPDNAIYWWVSPSHKAARMVYERAKVWLAPLIKRGRLKTHDTGPRRITDTVTGAFIEFFSTDDTDSIYGDEPHAIVCDEASRHRSESIHALETVALVHDAPIRYIGNVKNRTCWFWKQCRAVEADAKHARETGEPRVFDDWFYTRWTIWDAVDAGIHKRATMEKLRERYRRAGAMAVWLRDFEARLDGIGFAFNDDHFTAMGVAPAVEHGTTIMGLDPGGKVHPAGIVIVRAGLAEDGGPEVEVLHSEAWRGAPRMLRAHVVELIERFHPAHIASDRVMPLLTDDLASRYGKDRLTVSSWSDAVRWMHYEAVRDLAAAERLRVAADVGAGLLEDMRNVALDEDGNDKIGYVEYAEEELVDGEVVARKRHCDEFEALLRAMSKVGQFIDGPAFDVAGGGVGLGALDDELENWL